MINKVKELYEKIKKKDENLIYIIGIILIILIIGIVFGGLKRGIILSIIIIGIYTIYTYGDDIMNKFRKNTKLEKPTKSGNKKKFSKLKKIVLFGACGIVGLVFAYFGYIVISAPSINPEKLYIKEKSTVYDNKNNIIAELGVEKREKISYDEMPEVLIDAILATEDSNYFKHNGVDLGRFMVASMKQALGMGGGGASTITMQVVKNQFTSKTQSITRKLTDIYLSVFKLEKKYTKEEILEFYVNIPYLGGGSYGVSQAANTYFGKEVKDLSLPEAAMIAGLFQAPNAYDPFNNPEKAETRRNTVLYLMERHGYITKEQKEIAKKIKVSDMIKKVNTNNVKKYQGFVDYVVEEIKEKTELSPFSTSMDIYTTLDSEKQDYIDKITAGEIYKFKNDVVQTGIAVTDVNTGGIIALGAGRNRVGEKNYNFATMMKRQIGSTAKPLFDYGPALEYNNWSPAHPIVDEPYSYSGGKSINNSDRGYKGQMTMRTALAMSRNIPALKVFQQVNNKKIIGFVESLGITPEVENGKIHEAHSIGAFNGSNPLEMAGAYSAFSNGGYYTKPYSVNKIVLKDTKEEKEFAHNKKQVMNSATAFMITDMLNYGVETGLMDVKKIPGVNFASKTGTSNFDSDTISKNGLASNAINDLWVVGYDQQYAIGMWFGYEKIDKKYYNTTANWTDRKALFYAISSGIFEKTGKDFEAPDTVVKVTIEKNVYPYKLASEYTPDDMKITDYFRVGTEPTEISTSHMKIPDISNAKINYSESEKQIKISWNAPIYTDTMGIPTYNIYFDGTKIGNTDNTSYTIDVSDHKKYSYTIKTIFSNYSGESSGVNVSIDLSNTSKPDPVFSLVGNKTIDITIGNRYVEQGIKVLVGTEDVTNKAIISKTIIDKNGNDYSNVDIDTTLANEYTITYKIKYTTSEKNYEQTLIRTVNVKE